MFKHKAMAFVVLAALVGNAAAQEPAQVYIDALDVAKAEIAEPQSYNRLSGRDFELSDEEWAALASLYKQEVEKVIDREDEYVIVADAEAADYVIEGELLKLRPLAPKDDNKSRMPGERYVSQGAGSVKLRIVISDADSEIQVLEDSRDAGNSWGRNDRFSNRIDAKRMFNGWGHSLVKALDKIDS